MKKFIVLAMTLALAAGVMVGCSGGSTSSASASASAASSAATEASSSAAASSASAASASASASTSASASASAASSAGIATDTPQSYISADEAEKLLGDANTVFVDLRKAEDYAAGHIEGAINAPLDVVVDGGDYEAGTKIIKDTLGSNIDAKDLVLICYKGKKYAQAGTDVLNGLGANMSKIKTLEGGMEAWTTAGKALAGAAAAGEDPTRDNPIIVDKAKGEIRYLGFVDGTYFTEGTRHAVVYEGGSNGQKTIISGYGDEKEFYQGCIDLGWAPGNNLTLENQKGGDKAATIEGELLDVTVRWDGQDTEIPMWDCIEATNGDQRPAEWHFGGNIDRANEKNTGCVLCIDSCAVGIVSNAAWPSGTTDADGITYFHGKEDVLPADGTDVIVTFRKAA